MVGFGWGEILILVVCTGFFFLSPAAVALIFFVTQRSRGGPATVTTPAAHQPILADDRETASAMVIARLTQRFCPQCRSPLAVDAPEGLCPACLMAGGLSGDHAASPVNGLAATTPPSGSQPPAAGEWADLQQHFPQLEILELLGRGGMGTVYKARQRNLDRIIALKVIPPDAAKDPAFAERFARESRAMARLNHPNIVTVYDSGHEGELYWLMMEYVDGVNLRHALRASRLAPREALAIVPQVCDALQYAHDAGVVHRDIKPENVLLDRSGRVKIADFGLAKLLGKGPDDFTLTRTQQVMGTPRYMAPEQIERPATVDHRADIYSLGVVLYEMLTGELPLGRFEPPSHKVQVDVRIDQVVLRALEKAPERRYQRASQVKTELASAASWPASHPAPVQANERGAPVWRTPAPASKSNPTGYPLPPGGAALGEVLGVAVGIVMGVIMITGGLAAGIYGLVNYEPFAQQWWAWVGAGFGCIVGGLGSAGGSYNTYRQMAGSEDLMHSPRVTWFDWVMRAYLLLGIILLLVGLFRVLGLPVDTEEFPGLVLLGGIMVLQGAMFLLLRFGRIEWRRPVQKPLSPAQAAIRRRVVGPAIGLIITGILGLFPLLLGFLAVPAWTLVPQGGVPREIIEDSPWDQRSPAPPLPPVAPVPGPAPGFLPLLTTGPGINVMLRATLLAHPALLAQAGSARLAIAPLIPVLGLAVINLAFSTTIIAGGWRMRQLKSHGLAMVAAIMALLPCTFGWILGLPMGIWALVALMDPAVRDGFES